MSGQHQREDRWLTPAGGLVLSIVVSLIFWAVFILLVRMALA